MVTYLTLQPRSQRFRQRRRRRQALWTMLVGVTLAGGAYLLH